MICPECGGKTTVIDCARNIRMVIRRRKCKNCGQLYFTEERFIEAQDGRTALAILREEAAHRRDNGAVPQSSNSA